MEVQVELDEDKTFYSNGDVVAGDIVLYAESAVRISRIVVTLSGVAISRTESGKNSEVHQLLQKSQNIFPTDGLTGRSAHKGVAINKGYHVFPFAITFPQVSGCYLSTLECDESGFRYAQVRRRKQGELHLLRRLPPSISDSGETAEIKYFLKVITKNKGGPLSMNLKKTRDILYMPLSCSISPQRSYLKRQYLSLDPGVSGISEPLPWQVDVELLHGPCLFVGQPIPLRIRLTKLCEEQCKVWINDFQTMLIETTQVRAHDSTETLDRFWTVQTVANMKLRLHAEDFPMGHIIQVPESIWVSHTLSSSMLPNFEVCNIKRTYELELRLGLQIGLTQTQIIVREFRFSIYIVSTEFPPTWVLSGPASRSSLSAPQTPDMEYGHGVLDHGHWKEIG